MEKKARYDLQKIFEAKLESKISRYLGKLNKENVDSSSFYQELVDTGFIVITAPQEDPPKMSFITIDCLKNYLSGSSTKPGNIRLNMKTLISSIPDLTVCTFSIAMDNHILKLCAALEIWKTIQNVCTVDISKDQAFVIVALWKNCNSYQQITTEDGYTASAKLYQEYGEQPLTDIKYNQTLDTLIELRCIEIEKDVIWLRERISKKYIDSL